MTSVRRSLSALVVVFAIIGSTTASALVAAAHPLCLAKHHDCGNGTTIKPCCCHENGNNSNQSGPTAAKVTVDSTPLPVTSLLATASGSPLISMLARAHAAPPRAAPVDLPTLFATLLI